MADEPFEPKTVVMKMDIEGEEFAILSRLMARGTLCRLTAVAAEFHDERARAFQSIVRGSGVPIKYRANLIYMLEHAGEGCGVRFFSMGYAAAGSR